MDAERWERVQSLFHAAADRPEPERLPFLRTATNNDEALMADVLALFEEEQRGPSLLDRDVAQVAGQIIGRAATTELPFREFGPYRVREMLGEGGMGVVYLAERQDLSSLVAIKILRDAWLSPARRERFANEQRTLAQLNHPSIARLYDADTLPDGTPWFVMEYVDGLPLTEYCSRHNCTVEERLKLFRAVSEAVQYAHENTVIHRDLKPSNILVKGDGSVRLLDFGIAKQLDPLGMSMDQTRTGMRLMTPAYAAPEQMRGDRVGVQTDVYSLGVILYEMLAGRLPFDISNKTLVDAAMTITTETPAKPSTAARETASQKGTRALALSTAAWADLDVLCLTAMHKDSKRRYQSVEAVLRDIDHYLKGQPLEARPDSLLYTTGKFMRRNWRAVSAAAVIIALSAGLAVVVGLAVTRGPSNKVAPVKPRGRTVAVLPFQNGGSDHSLDFLSLALADEIATTLSHTRSLSVRPFATSSKYIQADLDLQKAGREMGAASIVTGRFVRSGQQVQITLEAVDVESNRSLWRGTVNVPAENMIEMQGQLAARTRGALAPVLGSPESAVDTTPKPKNEEAYDLFLRSTAVSHDPGPARQAIAMLERAVGLDPTYAPAWFSLARRYYEIDHFAKGSHGKIERYNAAMARAASLDPNSIATGAQLVTGRVEQGELTQAYQQAVDLVRRHPDSVDVHFTLSYVLRYAGLLDESAKECNQAFMLDAQTQTAGVRSCAVVFILNGDHRRAMDFVNLDLGSEWATGLTIDVLLRQGKVADASQLGSAHTPEWGGYDMLLAYLQRKPSPEIVRLARTVRAGDDPEVNYFSAAHLAYCGQPSAALEMLKQVIQGSYCSYPAIESDPMLASLRNQPGFAEVRTAAMACRNNFLADRRR